MYRALRCSTCHVGASSHRASSGFSYHDNSNYTTWWCWFQLGILIDSTTVLDSEEKEVPCPHVPDKVLRCTTPPYTCALHRVLILRLGFCPDLRWLHQVNALVFRLPNITIAFSCCELAPNLVQPVVDRRPRWSIIPVVMKWPNDRCHTRARLLWARIARKPHPQLFTVTHSYPFGSSQGNVVRASPCQRAHRCNELVDGASCRAGQPRSNNRKEETNTTCSRCCRLQLVCDARIPQDRSVFLASWRGAWCSTE